MSLVSAKVKILRMRLQSQKFKSHYPVSHFKMSYIFTDGFNLPGKVGSGNFYIVVLTAL